MKQPSFSDLGRASENWIRSRHNGSLIDFEKGDLSTSYLEIEQYMGFTFERVAFLIHEGICDYELSRKIHLLTSPHYRTIIKLWRIQNDYHDKDGRSVQLRSVQIIQSSTHA